MKNLLLLFLLIPLFALSQTVPPPIDNDPGEDEDTDSRTGEDITTFTLTIDGNLTVTNLTITGNVVFPPPSAVPDPDPIPGPNPIPPAEPPVNENPVAKFTFTPASGDVSLLVNYDANTSTDDGSISSYAWVFGDGNTGTGVTPSHTYTVAGNYDIVLTVTDNDGATSSTQPNANTVQVFTVAAPLPEYDITTAEVGHRHAFLTWTDTETWNKPWIIQRSTTASFTDPTDMTGNQDDDNTGAGTFRFLGINANNYVDIDDLAEGTKYFYRVGVVTNLSDHYQNAATPTFGTWLYGEATTTTLAAGLKLTYLITDGAYAGGAVADDGLNDWPAIDAALTAAQAAGGGIISFPAGVWDVWPTDADVDIVGGFPEIESGESITGHLFQITSDNITFLGAASGGVPTSFVNLFLWGKEPATKYLNVLTGVSGSAVIDIKRYFVFLMNDAEDFTVKNLDINMGAVPVDTGKAFQTLDDKRLRWDVSHKLFASFDTFRFKNVVFDTVNSKNCRGEVIYNGGGSEKILLKNCEFRQSNSSTISGSFDLEMVDVLIADSANAALESNLRSDRISFFTSGLYKQNHVVRGCTFIGLDQSASGVMKGLSGLKNFAGWLCFNEELTYQTVTDSTFADFIYVSFGPWYEYRNGFRFNCTFGDFPTSAASHMFYTFTSAKAAYTLDGGMSEILWLGDTINLTMAWPNHQPFFYSQVGAAAQGNQSPWTWEAVKFNSVGGSYKINRLWVDTWGQNGTPTAGRQNVLWKDWTTDSGITFDTNKFQFLGGDDHISPTFENFLQ